MTQHNSRAGGFAMNAARAAAERCLISTSVQLVMTTVRNDNFEMWRGILRDVLPYCEAAPLAFAPVRLAAYNLVSAKSPDDVSKAMTHLHYEVRKYYNHAAALHLEDWQAAVIDRVAV